MEKWEKSGSSLRIEILEFESETEIPGWANEWMSMPGIRRGRMLEKRLMSLRYLGDTRHFDR